jgi:hypothetical protein
MKNASGLSALDYTTVTNNARIAVYLAEIFFTLGQDIFCRDASGNTIVSSKLFICAYLPARNKIKKFIFKYFEF